MAVEESSKFKTSNKRLVCTLEVCVNKSKLPPEGIREPLVTGLSFSAKSEVILEPQITHLSPYITLHVYLKSDTLHQKVQE